MISDHSDDKPKLGGPNADVLERIEAMKNRRLVNMHVFGDGDGIGCCPKCGRGICVGCDHWSDESESTGGAH